MSEDLKKSNPVKKKPVKKKIVKKKVEKPETKNPKKIELKDFKPDHQNFILEYIRTRNAVKSYMNAYPKTKYEAAGVSSHQLLKNPKISEYLQNYFDNLWESRKVEIGRTFDNLLKIANADIGSVIEAAGDSVSIKDLRKIDTSIIQSISQSSSDTKYGVATSLNIKLFDKTKAISELLKVLGMITDKVEHSGEITIVPAKRPEKKESEEK
jgi:phage terminase small subunit